MRIHLGSCLVPPEVVTIHRGASLIEHLLHGEYTECINNSKKWLQV